MSTLFLLGMSMFMLTDGMLLVVYSQSGCCSLSSSRTVPACRGSGGIQSLRVCLTPGARRRGGHLIHDNLNHNLSTRQLNSTTMESRASYQPKT